MGGFMETRSIESRRLARALTGGMVRGGRIFAALSVGLALLPLSASSGEKSVDKAGEPSPTTVQARYRLRYDDVDVGRLEVKSTTTAKTYSVSSSGKVSVLFGTFGWSGSSNVSGTIEDGAPAPTAYAFDWHQKKKKKDVSIHIGYKDRVATEIAVEPPRRIHPDTVPLTEEHKVGTLDPLSAILMLTKVDNRRPCDRRIAIFDGTQRYDIVFTPKRQTQLPSPSGDGSSEVAPVCRVTYEPVAGHRANADTKAYASNRDVEVVLRRIPGSEMLIPYSLTIPTEWGTGSMVTERMDVLTAGK
jgi:hypothetical protein